MTARVESTRGSRSGTWPRLSRDNRSVVARGSGANVGATGTSLADSDPSSVLRSPSPARGGPASVTGAEGIPSPERPSPTPGTLTLSPPARPVGGDKTPLPRTGQPHPAPKPHWSDRGSPPPSKD